MPMEPKSGACHNKQKELNSSPNALCFSVVQQMAEMWINSKAAMVYYIKRKDKCSQCPTYAFSIARPIDFIHTYTIIMFHKRMNTSSTYSCLFTGTEIKFFVYI